MKVKTVIIKVLLFEVSMLPALLMCVYDAFKMARWDVYSFETCDGYTGMDLVDSFFNIAGDYITQNIPILAGMAAVIAIIAIAVALRKSKES